MSAAARRSGAAIVVRALAPFLFYSVARDIDAALGVLLHTTLDLPDFVARALGLLDLGDVARHAVACTVAGAALWTAVAAVYRRATGCSSRDAWADTASSFAVLWLRPVLTGLALVSLAMRPTYPYAFTLPVALTQDWAIATDLAIAAVVLAVFLPAVRVPAPGALGIGFIAFVVYALATPESARRWEGHPGNEPKTLRMAVALGQGLTLDVEGVSAGMEALTPRPLGSAATGAARGLGRQSVRMLAALAHGPHAVGADAIRATRVTRQTIRGKEGGVFTVLAPGPSMLVAPLLRIDRALNMARGTPGRLTLSLLAWNALAAALVAAVFLLARDAGAGAGAAAVVAGLTAVFPPFLFYSYQFYPEMLGALVLALALRAILLTPWDRERVWRVAWLGLLLASMPWLHQKFLPVWIVLVAMAVVRAVDALVPLRTLLALLVPQAVSAYLFALYNYAITGSVRPDALYLAWGPPGVSSARWGQGLLGLGLDARYGLLPYVPVYLLAAGGLLLPGPFPRKLRWGAVPVAVYYLTVAAADNWSGAVCNLGRYIMPVLPWAAALLSLVLAVARSRRAVLALFFLLAGLSAIVAAALWNDPHAANDCALLLARGAIADGNVYVPNLFIRAWSDGAPGLWARIAAWLVIVGALAWWTRRAAARRAGERPLRAMAVVGALVLALTLALERWPPARTAPRFPDAVEVAPGLTAFVDGRVEGGRAWLDPGGHEILVRTREPPAALRARFEGEGVVRMAARPPLVIPAAGLELDLPLEVVTVLRGRRGASETLARQRLAVEARGPVALRLSTVPDVR